MSELYTLKESTRYPGLFVKKYKNKVFYDNLWTDELIESRGRVVLADGTVVINPFTKIFNYKENGVTIPDDETCMYVNKVNGFMAAATYVPQVGKVVVSTTGSLDSDFVDIAEKYINPLIKELIKMYMQSVTLLFEVCDPEDQHIIKEDYGLYLIGVRFLNDKVYHSDWLKEKYLDRSAKILGCKRPDWGMDTFENIRNMVKSSKTEGVVVYGSKGTILKMKSPYYLATKAVARIKDISKLNKMKVDEEFYSLVEYIKSLEGFNALSEQERINIVREFYV